MLNSFINSPMVCGLLGSARTYALLTVFILFLFSSKYKLIQLPEYLCLRRKTLRHACFPTLRSVQIRHDALHIPRKIHLPCIPQRSIHFPHPSNIPSNIPSTSSSSFLLRLLIHRRQQFQTFGCELVGLFGFGR